MNGPTLNSDLTGSTEPLVIGCVIQSASTDRYVVYDVYDEPMSEDVVIGMFRLANRKRVQVRHAYTAYQLHEQGFKIVKKIDPSEIGKTTPATHSREEVVEHLQRAIEMTKEGELA